MSRLWIILGSIFTVAAIGMGSFGVVNALAHEETQERDVFAAADVTGLRVESHDGSIEVVGDGSVDEIIVDATISHGLRRTEYSVAVVDGTLVVDGDCPPGPSFWCRVDATIVVPSTLPVSIDSRNGTVSVRDIDAAVTIDTRNGPVEVRRLSGDLDLHTSNGPILAHGLRASSVTARSSNGPIELTFATAPDTVMARTSNGPVHIVVPDDDTAYALDLDTSSFSSTDTAIRTDPTSDHTISAKTSNGPITVYYPTS